MNEQIVKDGKLLRCGYTTGSCAAAAAKAAVLMLLGGQPVESVYLLTPKGIGLTLKVTDTEVLPTGVSCGIVKDSGDDPDVTDGITVYALAEPFEAKALTVCIDGGAGIGRVTLPGLDRAVGEAAINSVPRRMIENEVRAATEDFGYTSGLRVVISAPQGIELAAKTFNPRLGIVGGISILGTTGIVEPMSDDALRDTIRAELSVRAAAGDRVVLLTPGNYGEDYIRDAMGLDPDKAVKVSNFIGDALTFAVEFGFTDILLIGHIGKLVKLAGGMMNTHSRYGDCRAEIFAAHAGKCGATSETVSAILNSVMTDEMLDLTVSAGLRDRVMASILERIEFHLRSKTGEGLRVGAMTFSNKAGFLGATAQADAILRRLKGEKS